MTVAKLLDAPVLVVGAGIMGAGIAQIAAQAGHPVMLYDTREGAATAAIVQLRKSLDALVAKGKLDASAVAQTLSRILPISALDEASSAQCVIEAIVEKLDAKRGLFSALERIVSADCVLATNTSSISVTAIANGLQHPARLVGMHFFNPVPVMKLVEVVSGLHTDTAVAQAVFDLSKRWGKTPVHARSTPGFIVNRIARPFYAETLALLNESGANLAATPAVLDACMRAAGFRMGPCELMDLIGHDTNFAVTQSVYEANFYDKRYVPSVAQRDMVDGGLLGRKSGRGFYRYGEKGTTLASGVATTQEASAANSPALLAERFATLLPESPVLHGKGPVAQRIATALEAAQRNFTRAADSDWIGLELGNGQLRLTDGRTASEIRVTSAIPNIAVFDLCIAGPSGKAAASSDATPPALAWAIGTSDEQDAQATTGWTAQAHDWLQLLGFAPCHVADTPALVVARTLAMLINEAADAVHQNVCTESGANDAMKLGVNYPAGPFEWLAQWDVHAVCRLLDALDQHYRGERYRVSPWLRQRMWSTPKL